LQLGPCNPFDIGMKESQALLEKGVVEICSGIPTARISAFAGISGGGSSGNKEILAGFFEKVGFSMCANDTDAENASAVGRHGENGIAVIIGTGSIVYVMDGKTRGRVGGYGYLFDKSGSGFDIGRDGILAALRDRDGSGGKTVLRRLVKEKLGGEPVELLGDIYLYGKPFIASFASLVFEAADMGDEVAKEILRASYRSLGKEIRAGREKIAGDSVMKVVLVGGLTNYEKFIRPILEESLAGVPVRLEFCRRPPVEGALFLAGAPVE
ncbi:MAG: hypothetical protein MJ072_01650, partial [Clostridia bacterium]|nr:hypothetical protein [Clostridia bacterium]